MTFFHTHQSILASGRHLFVFQHHFVAQNIRRVRFEVALEFVYVVFSLIFVFVVADLGVVEDLSLCGRCRFDTIIVSVICAISSMDYTGVEPIFAQKRNFRVDLYLSHDLLEASFFILESVQHQNEVARHLLCV